MYVPRVESRGLPRQRWIEQMAEELFPRSRCVGDIIDAERLWRRGKKTPRFKYSGYDLAQSFSVHWKQACECGAARLITMGRRQSIGLLRRIMRYGATAARSAASSR